MRRCVDADDTTELTRAAGLDADHAGQHRRPLERFAKLVDCAQPHLECADSWAMELPPPGKALRRVQHFAQISKALQMDASVSPEGAST